MTDFERINGPRVDKIMGMLDTIDKSAKSQRVENAYHDRLLDPLRRRLGAIKPVPLGEVSNISSGVNHKQPQWATVRQMAEEASLEDLTYAVAVYLNRIDEHLKP